MLHTDKKEKEKISVPAILGKPTHSLSFLLTTRAKSYHRILLLRLKSLLLLTKQKRSSTIASLLGGNEDRESPWLQVPAKPKLLINVFTHMAHVKNKQTVQAA